jgi:hypothetical protein
MVPGVRPALRRYRHHGRLRGRKASTTSPRSRARTVNQPGRSGDRRPATGPSPNPRYPPPGPAHRRLCLPLHLLRAGETLEGLRTAGPRELRQPTSAHVRHGDPHQPPVLRNFRARIPPGPLATLQTRPATTGSDSQGRKAQTAVCRVSAGLAVRVSHNAAYRQRIRRSRQHPRALRLIEKPLCENDLSGRITISVELLGWVLACDCAVGRQGGFRHGVYVQPIVAK